MLRTLLRFAWRTVSLVAHISTWVASLGALALIVVMAVLLITGTRPIIITSGSMLPTIPVGSVVLAHKVDASQLKIGDVATVPLGTTKNVTHRVIDKKPKGDLTEVFMKGDANATPDPTSYLVKSAWRMESVMPAIGKLLMTVRSPLGLMGMGTLIGFSALTLVTRIGNLRKRHEENLEEQIVRLSNVVTIPAMSPTEIDLRVAELERQKGVLITAVNNDLRTPLTSILGYLEMLSDGELGEVNDMQRNALTAVTRNADRLQGMVGNLLTAAEIEGGQFIPSLGITVDASAILSKVHDNFEGLARDRSIDFELFVFGELGEVRGSADQVKMCVDHLVANAIKFTPEYGRVTIRAFNDAGLLTIAVSDTGSGIEPKFIPDLFDKFFRTPGAEEDATSGSGLGLAIVHAIVSAYEGVIAVDSAPGIGSTFTIKLPTIERANVLAGRR